MASIRKGNQRARRAARRQYEPYRTLDYSRFKAPASVRVNVILTYDNDRMIDGEMDSQSCYDITVHFDLDTPDETLDRLETDVVVQILNGGQHLFGDLSDLLKISLCYMTGRNKWMNDPRFASVIEYLCRNRAKYYFQPNQRDDYEDAIVARTGIASRTQPFVRDMAA